MNEQVIKNMKIKNSFLSTYACKDSDAYRFRDVNKDDIRTPFFRDIDKIVYSLSYTRYMDKTQVFSFKDNDNISKRMTHVQMVSKIARTIGRALCLNEDLIEAAALGHDLGHVPFGHEGERILNEISLRNNEGNFNHNIQSVRILKDIENNGKGSNITLQVLDAIMCHNGELPLKMYKPKNKSPEIFLKEYEDTYNDQSLIKKLIPMTMEGCVVRISDIIGYIGRDIEDAIRMNIIKEEDIPNDIKKVLGCSNKDIIDTIIKDLVNNSIGKDYLCMSDNIFNAIVNLKQFNFDYIYSKVNSKEDIKYYEKVFNTVFDNCLDDVRNNRTTEKIFTVYLNNMSSEYIDNTTAERKVIDYIAGMTDDFIINEFKEIIAKK